MINKRTWQPALKRWAASRLRSHLSRVFVWKRQNFSPSLHPVHMYPIKTVNENAAFHENAFQVLKQSFSFSRVDTSKQSFSKTMTSWGRKRYVCLVTAFIRYVWTGGKKGQNTFAFWTEIKTVSVEGKHLDKRQTKTNTCGRGLSFGYRGLFSPHNPASFYHLPSKR